MALILLSSLGLYSENASKKLLQQSLHPSSANNFFSFSSFSSFPLLNEYLSILFHTIIFGNILYLTLSCTSYVYFFVFNKEKFLSQLPTKDFKIAHDIKWSVFNIIGESFLVSLIRMAIPRYSLIYYDISEWPLWIFPLSLAFHIIWDETLTYWIHRFLHTYRGLYLKLHIVHHRSISVTPFTGFAFHPLDAFLQALPTFTSCFFMPIHFNMFLFFSVLTTIWAISIHDNIPALPCKLFLYATHHTIHHEKGKGSFSNFGKFTTVWDRLMGSYQDPDRIYLGWTSGINFFNGFNSFLSKHLDNKLSKKIS